MASLDTGSIDNFISPILIEQLTAQNYQLEYRPVDIILPTLGMSVHIHRSVEFEIQLRGEVSPLACLVLDTAEAYFDLLLGVGTIIALHINLSFFRRSD